jgi:hypothetical protein
MAEAFRGATPTKLTGALDRAVTELERLANGGQRVLAAPEPNCGCP